MNPLQPEIEAVGFEIFDRIRGATPRLFSRRNLTGRLLDWSMRNEALKTQLFRFVDVLPTLGPAREIARHALEYLDRREVGLPGPVRWALRLSPAFPWLTAWAARQGVGQLARTFIVAPTAAEAVPILRARRERPVAFTVDILGETAVSEVEAEAYQARYLNLIETLAREADRWPQVEVIDADSRGDLPRVNVSIKISALYSQIRPTDPEGALTHLAARLRPLLRRARELGAFINFDMESTALKDLTLALFWQLLEEPELQDYPHAGLALQTYLHDSGQDLEALLAWARTRPHRVTVRLVKGAYWDSETILARQRGWPVPVLAHKEQTDAQYEQMAERLLDSVETVRCAFGTHSVRSIAAVIAQAERRGISRRDYEFQMLYGMAEPIRHALVGMGFRVRDYCPIGATLPGMSYLVRRLLENTSNEGFLRATFSEHVAPAELLRDPTEALAARITSIEAGRAPETQVAATDGPARRTTREWDPAAAAALEPAFENEPQTDFTVAASRRQMREALARVRRQLGRSYPLILGGRKIWTDERIRSLNPARPDELIGEVAKGGLAEAERALLAARAAFPNWCRTTPEERAGVLERAAGLMRAERFELAALEVYETGKNWTESDADVAEAIDFCTFYAQEMRRLAASRVLVPGEVNVHHYIPRGLGVVIAPWNFPLAILCGMTTAAVVTGNCVVVKPSAQSVVVGARFVDLLHRAGLPPGVVNFLPGSGAEVGRYLVRHPEIAFIAFTGSREVGLEIWESAGQTQPGQPHLKKVICEMGGKNAVIIDQDADLDEAVPAVLHSAFGYSGQKCSALSRLIVLEGIYERTVRRLLEACRCLKVGLPEEPDTVVGPVIDRASRNRIVQEIERGKSEAELAFQGEIPAGEGWFVPPTVFVNVPPRARLAQEEIFGPVLCVLKAADLDQALAWANDCAYALTGGFFSRSPANIQRVKAELQAGNLYINRGITGALVRRHPFGGFKMSGGGTKAGGRDYLQHFLFPRCVSENTLRRGFAPEEPVARPPGGDR